MIRVIILMLVACTIAGAQDRSRVKCLEDSPERRGEEGCSILSSRDLVGSLKNKVYWHIDRFESIDAARKAAGPNSVAAEAHGSVWLLTVESKLEKNQAGQHVSWIGPLKLPKAVGLRMRVQSSLLTSGASTPVHTHSGPEVFYIVSGEQCLQTRKIAHRLTAGDSLVLAGGEVHRGIVAAGQARGALALVLHHAQAPASTDLDDPPPLVACK